MNLNLSTEKYDYNTKKNFRDCGRNSMPPARVSPQIHHLTLLLVPHQSVHPVILRPQHPYLESSLPQVPGPTTTHITVVIETETAIENGRKTANVPIASVSGKFGIVNVSNAIVSVNALLKFVTRSASRRSE